MNCSAGQKTFIFLKDFEKIFSVDDLLDSLVFERMIAQTVGCLDGLSLRHLPVWIYGRLEHFRLESNLLAPCFSVDVSI